MIGMVAFIVDIPGGLLSLVLHFPCKFSCGQILLRRMFVHKTSAAIIVLLVFLLLMNFFAVMLEKNLKNVGNINGKYFGRCRLYERQAFKKRNLYLIRY